MSHPKLGIIAGRGDLPVRIVETCRSQSRPFFVVAIEGQTAPTSVVDAPHAWVRLGAAGKALKLLRREKVEEVVLAGPVEKPSIAELRPDLWTTMFLARNGIGILDNENGLLDSLIHALKNEEGFRVVEPETLLAGLSDGERLEGR